MWVGVKNVYFDFWNLSCPTIFVIENCPCNLFLDQFSGPFQQHREWMSTLCWCSVVRCFLMLHVESISVIFVHHDNSFLARKTFMLAEALVTAVQQILQVKDLHRHLHGIETLEPQHLVNRIETARTELSLHFVFQFFLPVANSPLAQKFFPGRGYWFDSSVTELSNCVASIMLTNVSSSSNSLQMK